MSITKKRALVNGVWRCTACVFALWITGRPVENCPCEGCGSTEARAFTTGEENER